MPEFLTNGSPAPAVGSYEITVDGFTYDLETADLTEGGEIEKFFDAVTGVYQASAQFSTPEMVKGTVTAYTGVQAPSKNVRFTANLGNGSQYWAIVSRSVKSATRLARKYDVEIHRLAV
jgi:hypothetical protein